MKTDYNNPIQKINLLNLGVQVLKQWLTTISEPAYRAEQLLQWIYQKGVTDFEKMSNLSKTFRHTLNQQAVITPPEIVNESLSADGTCKWLLRLGDNNAIETVFIPEENRGTLCVSSQVGCALNCSFCATGKEGFNRNLSLAEIIGQLCCAMTRLKTLYPDRQALITNVVMMGMGEPLLNYEPVVQAMELMMSDHAFGLSKYKVTLSTAGLVPAMLHLARDSKASLAVSLHAPTDELRNQLVPLNKKYPLKMLMSACRQYFPAQSKRHVCFEYVMLAGVNDQMTHAKQLRQLLADVPCKVNLIHFNPYEGALYQCSSDEQIQRFQKLLIAAGINTRQRKVRGRDIDAACGQLAGKFHDRTGRHQRWLRTGQLTVPPSPASERRELRLDDEF